jgi:hypothetical protein
VESTHTRTCTAMRDIHGSWMRSPSDGNYWQPGE